MLAGEWMPHAALCSRLRLCAHARGGVPPLRRWGALRTEPPLRMSTYAAGWVPAPQTGRLEDGAPASVSACAVG